MQNPVEVYDQMLHNQIGTCFATTFDKIAEYFEFRALDYRKADKIYR